MLRSTHQFKGKQPSSNIKVCESEGLPGIQFFGFSGRGVVDGGVAGTSALSQSAPAWDEYSRQLGINMVRIGFSMRILQPHPDSNLKDLAEGFASTEASWAKDDSTYFYLIERSLELGWHPLICLNPSGNQYWLNVPPRTPTELKNWRHFCFQVASYLFQNWPEVRHFEIMNEPDIGYLDGYYQRFTYQEYRACMKEAVEAIREVNPYAEILACGAAGFWPYFTRFFFEPFTSKLIRKDLDLIDYVSYHNVGGSPKEKSFLEASHKKLKKKKLQRSVGIFNSEWAWWKGHDIDNYETAFRIGSILFFQALGGAAGSLYLGPAQPDDFPYLGVLTFEPGDPNQIKRLTKTFYSLRLVARGVVGGKRRTVNQSNSDLLCYAKESDNQILLTVLNPTQSHIEASISFGDSSNRALTVRRFDRTTNDGILINDGFLTDMPHAFPAKSMTQFILRLANS